MIRSRELHVVPQWDGHWSVSSDGQQLSVHAEATGATRAALERAGREGVPHVVIHDRYRRTRTARPPRRRPE